MQTSPIIQRLALVVENARTIAEQTRDLEDEQWLPQRPAPRADTLHSDPTGETVVDPERLALRAEVIATQREMAEDAEVLRRIAVRRAARLARLAELGGLDNADVAKEA